MAAIGLYDELNAVCQLDLNTNFRDVIVLLKNALDPGAGGLYTTPLFCYKMDTIIKLFKDEYLPQIEKKATEYKLQHGLGLNKGFMEPPLDVTIGDIPVGQYLRMFFQRDPLPFNHNGRTFITIKNVGGGDVTNSRQTLSDFKDYFTAATTTMHQLRDALSYYWRDNKVYLKYKMPTVSFTGDVAGTIITEVSTAPNRFLDGGAVDPTVVLGDKDRANLEQISLNSSTERVPGRNFGTNPVTYKDLNKRYTFPNFLLGEMLYKTRGKGLGPDFKVYRPYKGDLSPDNLEFWAMNYEDPESEYFPYDKTKYVLPAGWRMIERADGVIMYISPQNILHSDFPPGSYYILNGENTADTRRTVFQKSARHDEIMMQVTAAIALGLGHEPAGTPTGAYNAAQMMLPIVQAKLQLLAYTTNLIMLEQMIYAGGDIKKKKTKRRNVIKHVAKSKKKHNHK
jgi:hypothetical protein